MIQPVLGQRAQKSNSVDITKAIGAMIGMPEIRSGRCSVGAVRRKAMTLMGTTRYVMMVATEMTSAKPPQPLNLNKKMNDTTRISHMAGCGMPYFGCTRPKI